MNAAGEETADCNDKSTITTEKQPTLMLSHNFTTKVLENHQPDDDEEDGIVMVFSRSMSSPSAVVSSLINSAALGGATGTTQCGRVDEAAHYSRR